MKILKIVLLVGGVALITYGLYIAFVPQEVIETSPLVISEKPGLNNQILGMIGLGFLAFIASIFIKNRR
jgi:hypothetical protein